MKQPVNVRSALYVTLFIVWLHGAPKTLRALGDLFYDLADRADRPLLTGKALGALIGLILAEKKP